MVGVEIDPRLAELARRRFADVEAVRVLTGDFLALDEEEAFDYVVGNPPYISYERIPTDARAVYRRRFSTAVGRFDLYFLFFEKALRLLRPGGRLAFVTPEKYLYVLSAAALRRLLARYAVEEVELIDEDAFRGVLAYPAITVVRKEPPAGPTLIRLRDGGEVMVPLPTDGSPWLSAPAAPPDVRLGDLALRISAGVATGLDEAYVVPRAALPRELEPYAYPTVGGAELASMEPGEVDYRRLRYVMLVPYGRHGELLDEAAAAPLLRHLSRWRKALERRYAVRIGGKPWYAFHEDPPMRDVLRPKIMWRDIAREPAFYLDTKGAVVPRHTVYYLVPKDPRHLPTLLKYLNGEEARRWLEARCRRAANGYLRLQSHVLRELPIPIEAAGIWA